ncbi:hypothetical protein BBJ28_00016749 [Nothophytophthora sp. Chile5]|nr:hypothetical protein BBJ28_00016749 [Nothophytophthora sp. Chile5]
MSASTASLASGASLLRDSASAPVVYPPYTSSESRHDLGIVRKIVEREGCLEALQQLLTHRQQQHRGSVAVTAPMVVQSILDQLRSVSVQIVEEIEQWQQQQQLKTHAPLFRWRGVNYLLKMTSDLDFLAAASNASLLDALQLLRLTQNPFLASLHLGHPALRDREPDMALQLLGDWVGDVDMRRVFFASKVLLREREADARRRQLHQQQQQSDRDLVAKGGSAAAVVPREQQQRDLSMRSRPQREPSSSSGAAIASGPREAAMRKDLALSRELLTQAEHELDALRDELAALQARLEDVVLPEKRRRLQNQVGGLVNELKFRSGDLYQRRNELKRKEAIYRGTRDRRPLGSLNVDQNLTESLYSPVLEAALQEDERVRSDLVERVSASLARSRAGGGSGKRTMESTGSERQPHRSSNGTPDVPAPPQLQLRDGIVEQWGVQQVQRFLDALGLDGGSYGAAFSAQGIDGALLAQATESDLEELGVAIRLHRLRILQAVAAARKS